MKMITALVRPSKVDAVKTALVGIEVIGMTVTTAAAAAELVEVLLAPPPHGILA